MTCELKIKQLEKNSGRKLTEKEKKEIREKMGHAEFENEEREELEVVA